MAGSTISGTITNTVTLGSASYPSPLTVTGTGAVLVSAYGSIGVYGPASTGTLINDGVIAGGVGMAGSGIGDTKGGTGGVGLSLRSASTATNDGLIVGGGGGYGGGSGGAGAYVGTGAALTNQATITGGFSGDPSEEEPGVSGAGVVLHGGILTNSGAIEGGYTNGYDGSGVVALAGTLINTGIISGGTGVSQSYGAGVAEFGSGVYLSSSATLLNDGTIVGSSRGDELSGSGGSGIYLAAGGTLTITGLVIGGASFYGAGAGVRLADGGSLDNVGTVVAGAGAGGVGVLLVDGGTLTNAATIIGGIPFFGLGGDGVFLQRGGVLMNTAFIIGGQGSGQGSVRYIAGGVGVGLGSGAIATNSAGATITGGAGISGGGAGVALVGGTLTNLGAVAGGNAYSSAAAASGSDGNGGIGVSLTDGGMVTNSASIGGGLGGHRYFGAEGGAGASIGGSTLGSTLINLGIITGGSGENVAPGDSAMLTISAKFVGGAGVYIGAPETLKQHGTIVSWATDSLTNTATIVGGAGADVGAGGTFTNKGLVQGGDGVTEASKGTILNTGIIVSGIGAYVAAGSTLNNYGTVSGGIYNGVTADAVLFSAGGTLIVEPGASFVGQVVGSSTAADTLDLGSYYSEHGTLAGIGTQFVNFGQITIDAKASWTLTGANTIASGATLTELNGASLSATGTLLNNGAIVLDPSTMVVAALTGTGSSAIEAGSTLEVQSTIATGQTIAFGGTGAYLHLDAPDSVSGSITNFGANETIDLKGINPSTVTYTSGHLTFSGGGIPLELANGGTVFASMGTDGAVITLLLCFCANTRIMTPSGERPVQDLAIGDLVTTHRGEARPIVWIGNGKVLATRGRRNAATPVIVHKGALADNVPNRDLRVTKGHAFWFGGVLIPVEFLINHRLIEWDDRAQEVELYHIELETHDVLVANGAPAESYRDDGNRWLFRNANTGWGLPPLEPFAPVLTGGAVVDGVWRRLLDRAGPRRSLPLTDDPDLHLLADGRPLDVTERVGGAYIFRLPSVPSVLRVVSRAAAPAELGLARDSRVLGVALRRLVVRKGTHFRVTRANDDRLADGFHAFETDNDFRWTEGDAAIPAELFAGFTGPLELVLQIGATARYLADNRVPRAA